VLLYGDEADIHLNPHLAYGWFRLGAPRCVPAAGTNQKRGLFGAFNPRTGRLLVHAVKQKTAEGFVTFLRCVLRAYAGRHVYLVIDNGPVHTAGQVLAFLEQNRLRLTVLWLPKYSPNLNLIERLWGYLKRSALANIFYGKVTRLLVAVARAVRAFNDRRNSLLRILFADSAHKAAA
jgi:transposase